MENLSLLSFEVVDLTELVGTTVSSCVAPDGCTQQAGGTCHLGCGCSGSATGNCGA